jgi:hypothetical protein
MYYLLINKNSYEMGVIDFKIVLVESWIPTKKLFVNKLALNNNPKI